METVIRCAGSVWSNSRTCQRTGTYQDADGVRWWCGLHNPNRNTTNMVIENSDDIETSAVRQVDSMLKQPDLKALFDIIELAQIALIQISNTNANNWPANTSPEKYKIIMAHMAGNARDALDEISKRMIK
jgi:hypothetical protein